MSYTESDAMRDEGMDYLYEQFKIEHEGNFIFNGVDRYYKTHPEIVKKPLQNLIDSRVLFEKEFITPAFLHAIISIETGIKSVLLGPILHSLTVNDFACDLLYKSAFKLKSVDEINSIYYKFFHDITGFNLKNTPKNEVQLIDWKEWKRLYGLRNNVVHDGVSVEKENAESAIKIASNLCEKIIPDVLDIFMCNIENGTIQQGSREYIRDMLRRNKKQ